MDYSLKVRPTGERFRYEVQSVSQPENPNQVDLEGNEGVGICTCEHWIYTCNPNFMKANILGTEKSVPYSCGSKQRTRCKHIEAAREFCLNSILEESYNTFIKARANEQHTEEANHA